MLIRFSSCMHLNGEPGTVYCFGFLVGYRFIFLFFALLIICVIEVQQKMIK